MKRLLIILSAWLPAAAIFAAEPGRLAIIPQPQKMEVRAGEFHLTPQTAILADPGSLATAKELAAMLNQATGYSTKVEEKRFAGAPAANAIWLTTQGAPARVGAEGYELNVSGDSVVIHARTEAGLYYGAQTLRQLLPPEIFSPKVVPNADWRMPCVQIEDWPRFKWRGLMLDVGRHFYNGEEVEKILDEMAAYKMNVFHWHLTDDQGWRIEIKKYPRLTEIGAWRTKSALARLKSAEGQVNITPAWAEPSADKFRADGRYGGFYPQAEIREIVAYAAERHITIVPEIEMPGHSVAALAAYPQYACFKGPFSTDVRAGVADGIYNPANPETFVFLDNILSEVFELFPGKYIHVGGDEVRKNYWKENPECQALMKREGLKDEAELQSWFIRKIEKFVNSRGKTLVGWSEIAQGGLAQNAVVMDWIGGGKEAASAGHDVVMTPTEYCYFDHYQSKDREAVPHAIGGYLPLEKVYSYDPIPAALPARFQAKVLGSQGNLWTEYVASLPYAQYMIFPRLCALSEVVWSPKNSRDWDDFQRRLKIDEQQLGELGVHYRP
jgi:hexosaminidase